MLINNIYYFGLPSPIFVPVFCKNIEKRAITLDNSRLSNVNNQWLLKF